jgi:hypothetical protein
LISISHLIRTFFYSFTVTFDLNIECVQNVAFWTFLVNDTFAEILKNVTDSSLKLILVARNSFLDYISSWDQALKAGHVKFVPGFENCTLGKGDYFKRNGALIEGLIEEEGRKTSRKSIVFLVSSYISDFKFGSVTAAPTTQLANTFLFHYHRIQARLERHEYIQLKSL